MGKNKKNRGKSGKGPKGKNESTPATGQKGSEVTVHQQDTNDVSVRKAEADQTDPTLHKEAPRNSSVEGASGDQKEIPKSASKTREGQNKGTENNNVTGDEGEHDSKSTDTEQNQKTEDENKKPKSGKKRRKGKNNDNQVGKVSKDGDELVSKSTGKEQIQDVVTETKEVKEETCDREASPIGGQVETKNKKKKKSKNTDDIDNTVTEIEKSGNVQTKFWKDIETECIECPEAIVAFFRDLAKDKHWHFLKDNIEKFENICHYFKTQKTQIKETEHPPDKSEGKQHKGKGRHADSAKHTQEIEKLKAEIEKLQKANAELSKSIKYNGEEMQKQKTEIKQLGLDKEKLHNNLKMRDEVCLKLQQKLSDTENEVHRLWRKCTQEEEKCSQLEVVIKEITKDRDSFKDRFSKLAGAKLTSGNAHIQDLSDINRPQKLGERYSELYDNEWTDALEELQEEFDEKEAIKKLLEYFKSCSSFCLQKAEEQGLMVLKSVTDAIELTDISIPNGDIDHTDTPAEEEHVESLSPSDSKMLKDLIKAKGTVSLKFVQKRYMLENQKETSLGEKVKDFINRCIEVCWFSSIQDPPISFDWNFQEGSEMDDKFVKVFTKSGTKIDYVVWPVMKLYDGGEVLCKGVVQPFPDGKSKKKK